MAGAVQRHRGHELNETSGDGIAPTAELLLGGLDRCCGCGGGASGPSCGSLSASCASCSTACRTQHCSISPSAHQPIAEQNDPSLPMGLTASLRTIDRQRTAIVLREEERTVGLDYFPEGDAPVQDAFATAFLRRLRERAREWVTDINASDTLAETLDDPVAISISVPGVSGPTTTLWVLCRHEPGRVP